MVSNISQYKIPVKLYIPKVFKNPFRTLTLIFVILTISLIVFLDIQRNHANLQSQIIGQAYKDLDQNQTLLENQVASLSAQLNYLQSRDEYRINQNLDSEIKLINQTFNSAVNVYEKILILKDVGIPTEKLDQEFTKALLDLSHRNYASASTKLTFVQTESQYEMAKQAALTVTIPTNIPANNIPPGDGYSRQKVSSDVGEFQVDIVAADLGSTRVIVDTASDSNCGNECPVLSLGNFVSRNGAYAGINGSYFCPAAYPSCAGKTNSFDTLLMNKNKTYFNSDNNIYSTVPAVVFGSGWIRFINQSLEWGRDTGIDSMIANQPLLISGGNVVFGGDGDPKKGSKSGRSFVANKGNIVYIGVVRNATVTESAHVLKTLGMDNALNLDSGGSTALWSGGYKAGPGRNIPNAILFVKK